MSQGSRDSNVSRILDANANRAIEGLRVVEEYARFALDDRHLTELCKQCRHDLSAVLGGGGAELRIHARETQQDVGTGVATSQEYQRADSCAVCMANVSRVKQALRCLEEYGKTLDSRFAASIEQLRYRFYTIEKAVCVTRASAMRLAGCHLYVLSDGAGSLDEFTARISMLVECGVPIVQLRDKSLNDRRLLERARRLREITSAGPTLFIMNDRPDIAFLARADGVHVGQDELTVRDARAIVGVEALVGVSTHSIEQARQAVLDGANYIGVGPVFPSGTKAFDTFPGLAYVRQVAAEISLPAFAIGGIFRENVGQVLAAGATRIAVGGAIFSADDSRSATRELSAAIEGQTPQRAPVPRACDSPPRPA